LEIHQCQHNFKIHLSVSGQYLTLAALPSGKEPHFAGSWIGSGAGLDVVAKTTAP
jgi:hypothetical protein